MSNDNGNDNDNGSGEQEARDSFASILSYYVKNRSSIENMPGWVDRAASGGSGRSGVIEIGLAAGTVPSDETD